MATPLAVIFSLCLLSHPAVGAETAPADESSPAPLFKDTFESGEAKEWTPNPADQWSVVKDGETQAYRFDFDWKNETGRSVAGSPDWTDYTFTTDLKITDLQPWSETRLCARYMDNKNFYLLQIEEIGGEIKIAMLKVLDGRTTRIGSSSLPIVIEPNTWYTISWELNGSDFVVRLGEDDVISANDLDLPAGRIALGGRKQDVLFDNVIVEPIE